MIETLAYNWGAFTALLAMPPIMAVILVCAMIGMGFGRWWIGFAVFACLLAAFSFILSGAFLSLAEGAGTGGSAFLLFFALHLLVPALALYGLVYIAVALIWAKLRAVRGLKPRAGRADS